MEALAKKIEDIEDKMDSCKGDLHQRMSNIEKLHIEKLIKLEVQMESAIKGMVDFVTKAQFEPVKLIAFGLAGGVLVTVLAAILAKVIMK